MTILVSLGRHAFASSGSGCPQYPARGDNQRSGTEWEDGMIVRRTMDSESSVLEVLWVLENSHVSATNR